MFLENGNHNKMTSVERADGPYRLLRQVWPLLLVGVVVAALAGGGDPVRQMLRYDTSAMSVADEWWRLATGHLVHQGWRHTLLNLAGLGLVILLFPREYSARQWWLLLLACIAGISTAFVLLRPDLDWYVGLSGVLHGLFAAGAVRWIANGEFEGYLLGAFLAGKLVWEQAQGALPLSVSTAGGPVIVDAHLYGAVCGVLTALMLQSDSNRRHR